MSRHPKIRSVAYGIYALLFFGAGLLLFPLGFIPRSWTYKLGRFIGLHITYRFIKRKCFLNFFYAYDDRMNEKRATALTKKVAVMVRPVSSSFSMSNSGRLTIVPSISS